MSAAADAASLSENHTEVETRRIVYNDSVARWFVGASVVWGIVGMLISLPGNPLPTFGAGAAAGDLFDVALAIGTRI